MRAPNGEPLVHPPRATFANVMSSLALFVALGGASYAAVSLPKNSVGAKQIRAGAVDNSKIKAGSLMRTAFGAGQLPAGATGPPGAKGDTGAQGLQGVEGSAGGASAIRLAALTHYPSQDIPGDNQWHNYVTITFTAASNTIYSPNWSTDWSQFSSAGAYCPGTLGWIQRTVVNGVDVTPADVNGYTYPPAFYGPYPVGTPMTLQMQYKVDCVTQPLHLPPGDVLLVPYQTS
jgi:hypothetical protein